MAFFNPIGIEKIISDAKDCAKSGQIPKMLQYLHEAKEIGANPHFIEKMEKKGINLFEKKYRVNSNDYFDIGEIKFQLETCGKYLPKKNGIVRIAGYAYL